MTNADVMCAQVQAVSIAIVTDHIHSYQSIEPNAPFDGLVQKLDSGLWTGLMDGLWTDIWTGFWTTKALKDNHFQPSSSRIVCSLEKKARTWRLSITMAVCALCELN